MDMPGMNPNKSAQQVLGGQLRTPFNQPSYIITERMESSGRLEAAFIKKINDWVSLRLSAFYLNLDPLNSQMHLDVDLTGNDYVHPILGTGYDSAKIIKQRAQLEMSCIKIALYDKSHTIIISIQYQQIGIQCGLKSIKFNFSGKPMNQLEGENHVIQFQSHKKGDSASPKRGTSNNYRAVPQRGQPESCFQAEDRRIRTLDNQSEKKEKPQASEVLLQPLSDDIDIRSRLKTCWGNGMTSNITWKMDQSQKLVFQTELSNHLYHIIANGHNEQSQKKLFVILDDSYQNLSQKEYDKITIPRQWLQEIFVKGWESHVSVNLKTKDLKFIASQLLNRKFSDRRRLQNDEILFLNALLENCDEQLDDLSFSELMRVLTCKISALDYELFKNFFERAAPHNQTVRDKFADAQSILLTQIKNRKSRQKGFKNFIIFVTILLSIMFMALPIKVYDGFDYQKIFIGGCNWGAGWLQSVSVALLQIRIQTKN